MCERKGEGVFKERLNYNAINCSLEYVEGLMRLELLSIIHINENVIYSSFSNLTSLVKLFLCS